MLYKYWKWPSKKLFGKANIHYSKVHLTTMVVDAMKAILTMNLNISTQPTTEHISIPFMLSVSAKWHMVLLAELATRFAVGIRQEHLLFLQDARMGAEANRREHFWGHKPTKQPAEMMPNSECRREHKGTELQEEGGAIQCQVPGIREEHGSKFSFKWQRIIAYNHCM